MYLRTVFKISLVLCKSPGRIAPLEEFKNSLNLSVISVNSDKVALSSRPSTSSRILVTSTDWHSETSILLSHVWFLIHNLLASPIQNVPNIQIYITEFNST